VNDTEKLAALTRILADTRYGEATEDGCVVIDTSGCYDPADVAVLREIWQAAEIVPGVDSDSPLHVRKGEDDDD
jgi:hypothetical protein